MVSIFKLPDAKKRKRMNVIYKIAFTLLVILIVPIYWYHYGPQNFLWLSDIGLFLTLLGLWCESALLISMAAVAILPLEIVWTSEFIVRLFWGSSPIGLTDYMFDQQLPFYLRAISLFHLLLPITWLAALEKWGYDTRAWKYATILCTAIFIATYALPEPFENINLIFSPQFWNLTWITPREWFVGQVIVLPIFVFWPMHKVLGWMFQKHGKSFNLRSS